MRKGLTLVEILISITILLVVGAVSIGPILNWRAQKKIDYASDITLSALKEARNLTVNAYGGNQYGVYLGQNDRIINFVGSSYNPSDASNTVTVLPGGEIISTSTLGTSIVFQKFTGNAGVSGSIILKDVTNASTTRTILVDISGIVSLQK